MLSPEHQSDRMFRITNDRLNPVWLHRVLYSCTHMATVGVKGLTAIRKERASYLAVVATGSE